MKFFFGLIIGLLLAIGIAAGAMYFAFGDLSDIGERDKSKDITETYDFTDFDRIEAAGVYELDVEVGGDFSITISGAPEAMERVEVSVENGELILDEARRERGRRTWRNHGLTAVITLPALNGVDIAGIVDGDITGVDAEDFRADLSGVGDLNIEGSCGTMNANVSGIGDFDASSLECKIVEIDVSGIGDASVYASEAVDISVSGIGSVSVYGSPAQVEKDSSFISNITIK